MGTTRAAAGGMENFVKIDREYVLATAAAARVPGVKQRLLYVSVSASSTLFKQYCIVFMVRGCQAFGADKYSRFPYARWVLHTPSREWIALPLTTV